MNGEYILGDMQYYIVLATNPPMNQELLFKMPSEPQSYAPLSYRGFKIYVAKKIDYLVPFMQPNRHAILGIIELTMEDIHTIKGKYRFCVLSAQPKGS